MPIGTNIWTGTEYDGTFSGQPAGEWNQGTGSADTSSTPSATGTGWISGNSINCDDGARLYGLTAPYDTVTGKYLSWGTAAVPEPSSLVTFAGLFGMGLLGYWRRRRKA